MIACLHRGAPFLALFIGCIPGRAQNISFDARTPSDSPVILATDHSPPWRAGSDRRIFVAITNKSDKAISAVTFEQTISIGSKTAILTIERSSIVIASHQKKRISVSVEDVLERIKSAAASGEKAGNPVVCVVAVEFLDGTLWHAP